MRWYGVCAPSYSLFSVLICSLRSVLLRPRASRTAVKPLNSASDVMTALPPGPTVWKSALSSASTDGATTGAVAAALGFSCGTSGMAVVV